MVPQKPRNRKTSQNKVKKTASTGGKETPQKTITDNFPIVALGASAGGLKAFKSFLGQVAPDSGMAYILIVHLAPKQPSIMAELLQRVTSIPVQTAEDGQCVKPDHIYVIPPNKEIALYQGKIQLFDVVKEHPVLPIDAFLRSLAQDQGARGVAVILSGTGTDGTLGIMEIKACDGLVLAQSEDSAEYDGMPRSAIGSGVVDMILHPEQMPEKIVHFFAHKHTVFKEKTPVSTNQKAWLDKIFAILRTQVGHDFSQYKLNTLLRRIGRRMGVNQIENNDHYVRFLRENPEEVEALFRDLLIGVTGFFRDPESFEYLKAKILPELFDGIEENGTLRAWVPGCSTGEEVYSLAMVMREVLDKNSKRIQLQLFGTDIDDFAIDKARSGLYPDSISANVSQKRLKRFFHKEGDFYRIGKEIRDCAVFSVQDLTRDPPFSRLHLLCCRNLLIYLNGKAQHKLLPLFHYTLRPAGILILGSSESIGVHSNLFDTLNKKWKIFKRIEVSQDLQRQIDFPSGQSTAEMATAGIQEVLSDDAVKNVSQITQKAILEQFAPTALLVDRKGNVLYIQGRTGKYMEPPSGLPTNNILDMARQGLRIELSLALRAAKSSNQPEIRRNISVQTNGDTQMINLHIRPQHSPKELAGRFLVVFEDIEKVVAQDSDAGEQGHLEQESVRIDALERELQNTRESHQTTIEELESSNEELKSTNEELQSSNEELQSTNEELESSKEELQSLNEELQTVNAELQSKVEELYATHDDMRNLLNSTEIATIFVDNDMRIRRFTAEATDIVNLIQSDIGRPLQHVVSNLTYDGMDTDLQAVLENLRPKQVEVQTTSGDWYKMRIIPYRTMDNRIDGAVLTFSAINEQKQTQQILNDSKTEIQQAWQLTRDVFDMNKNPMAVLDDTGKIVIANTAFAQAMGLDADTIQDTDILVTQKGLPGWADLKKRLKGAVADKKDFLVVDGQVILKEGADEYTLSGRILQKKEGRPYRILLRFEKAAHKAG